MGRAAIYPGSFDPVTYGHVDLIQRAARVFDEVIVAVAENTHKNTLFDVDERFEMVREAAEGIKNVQIERFKGLVVDYADSKGIDLLIRGVRVMSDFEYELQMALANRRFNNQVETVFLMPSEDQSFLSSSLIKEAVSLGADVSSFVPAAVAQKLKAKLKKP